MYRRVKEIAGFLRGIEEDWPDLKNGKAGGWERYLHERKPEGKMRKLHKLSMCLWVAVILITAVTPSLLRRNVRSSSSTESNVWQGIYSDQATFTNVVLLTNVAPGKAKVKAGTASQ